MKELSIIVVNFRTPGLTLDCLRSVAPVVGEVPGAQVIVVENGSGDDSAEKLRAAIEQAGCGARAKLLVLDQNTGFAGGNNRGMAFAGASRFYLLLNSDTIVNAGVFAHCYRVMQEEPEIGVMSCMLVNRDGSYQNTTRDFPSPLKAALCAMGLPWALPRLFGWANVYDVTEAQQTQKRDCDWVGGAFMLIRGEMLDRIGGLDEDFFFYGEDAEFCFRARKAGYRVHYDPAVRITHLGGSSSDPPRLSPRLRSGHMWQARYRLQAKCYGRGAAMAAWMLDVVINALQYVRMCVTGRARSQEGQFRREVLAVVSSSAPAPTPAGRS